MSIHNTNGIITASTSTNERSITSIIEDLENKFYLKNVSNPFDSTESDIFQTVAAFSAWMDSKVMLIRSGCTSNSEVTSYLRELEKLSRRITHQVATVRKEVQRCKFICSICKKRIKVPYNQNIWKALQSHEHFEQQYVGLICGKSTSSFDNTSVTSLASENSTTNTENENAATNSGNESLTENTMNGIVDVKTELESMDTNSISKDPEGNNFKFNFKQVYDEEVEKLLYPSNLIHCDSVSNYSIRIESDALAYCLLCKEDVTPNEESILSHLKGSKHVEQAQGKHLDALKAYHSFWVKFDPVYQWHQVWFELNSVSTKCRLCGILVNYDKIEAHLRQPRHKLKVGLSTNCLKSEISQKLMVLYNNDLDGTSNGSKSSKKVAGTYILYLLPFSGKLKWGTVDFFRFIYC